MGIIQPGTEAVGLKQGDFERGRLDLRGRFHRDARQLALAPFGARSSLNDDAGCRVTCPRRLTDLLSSGAPARAKRSRERDQPRTDEDQPLVARAQSGDAAAFDELVVKYSPRLYGLVYNMTRITRTRTTCSRMSSPRPIARSKLSRQIVVLHLITLAVNMTLNFLKKRGAVINLSLDDVDREQFKTTRNLSSSLATSPVREADLGELQRRLNEAMMKLSDEHRAVVTMFHIQECTRRDQ